MKHWLVDLELLLTNKNDVIRVVVAATRGSAPREAGASMLVYRHGTSGTLGGGHLEFKAIELARDLLDQSGKLSHCQRFSLGAALGQCCGGIVDLWWERFTAADLEFVSAANIQMQQASQVVLATLAEDKHISRRTLFLSGVQHPDSEFTELSSYAESLMRAAPDSSRTRLVSRDGDKVLLERLDREHTPLWIFGAGHVGQAIVSLLNDLPFDITWVDSRAGAFPTDVYSGVTTLESEIPAAEVRYAPADAWFLVLTHDHDLDYAICQAILAHGASGFIGLIGSRTKAARFNHRLTRQGFQAERITCPIGIAGISGKEPATIAVAVVAQLLQECEAWQLAGHSTSSSLQLAMDSQRS